MADAERKVIRLDPVQRKQALVSRPPPAAPAPQRPARPAPRRRTFFRSSLRAQAAVVFALLAIFLPGLMGSMALGLQASGQAQAEQDALQNWQLASASLDAAAQSVISHVFLWNDALETSEPQKAQQLQTQIGGANAKIKLIVAEISALSLPRDAADTRTIQGQAALAVTSYAASITTAGGRSDAAMQAADAVARFAWDDSANQVGQFIDTAIQAGASVVQERGINNYRRLALVVVLFVVGAAALAIFQFRLTLNPIVRLAAIANALAAGRQATISATRRPDEIGQLTGALAAWQEIIGGALFRLRGEVAGSATTLSVAAQNLASVTLAQTAAAAATSASMEVLSQSSTTIADKIDRVAIQAGQTRSSLELAQADLRSSGDRTLALAGRVDEIEGILERINDIADQTNLLALNAAIEAARAGDAGRGFAVVADEVRRLAEKSKAAAADIARLVEGAQAQSGETVMALDKGVKQMEQGLGMMKEMADLSGQVQVATQQQRSSTAEVVIAIEHMAEGSRSVAITAQDLASAAASQGQLAADLAGSGWNPHPTTTADQDSAAAALR
jgi:methyl-accepting chemotaxis protein